MSKMKSFRCESTLYPDLVSSTQDFLVGQKFKYQRLVTEDGGIILQIEKANGWKKMVGMGTALNVIFHQFENTVNVEIGAGRWADKAVVGAVSMVVLWPLAVTSGIGAWEQAKMPERILEHIALFLNQHEY